MRRRANLDMGQRHLANFMGEPQPNIAFGNAPDGDAPNPRGGLRAGPVAPSSRPDGDAPMPPGRNGPRRGR